MVPQHRTSHRYSDFKYAVGQSGLYMHPSVGFNVSSPGKYLIHSECDGTPHCVALEVGENGGCTWWDGNRRWSGRTSHFVEAHALSIDASTVITVALKPAACDSEHGLLNLKASGRRGRRRSGSRQPEPEPPCLLGRSPSPIFQRAGSPFRSPEDLANKRRSVLALTNQLPSLQLLAAACSLDASLVHLRDTEPNDHRLYSLSKRDFEKAL